MALTVPGDVMSVAASEHTRWIARSTHTLSRSSVRTRTNRFHGRAWRKTSSFESVVRYAARPVVVGFAEFKALTATAPKSSKNGPVISDVGETTGVGRAEGMGLPGLVAKKCEILLRAPVDLLAGEARRESVFRMTDLRFVGCGSAEGSIGNDGRETDGCASWSL